MEYEFAFTEINYGSITIKSDTKPTRGDVTDAILKGNAYFVSTEYKNITLCGSTPQKSKPAPDKSR